MHLHRLARAYGTTPAAVLRWSAFEMAVNSAALDQADASRAQRVRTQKGLMVVYDLASED